MDSVLLPIMPRFTYLQIHQYLILPPIGLLAAIYWPLLGRREYIKIGWLSVMATLYTTPWDNFVISQGSWSYPTGSILGKFIHIPLEEHMFFILQPVLMVLLHSIITLPQLFPFSVRKLEAPSSPRDLVQTLRRRPAAAAVWLGIFGWGASLLWEVQQSKYDGYTGATGNRGFYLGMILCWISPIIGWLTYLGGNAFATRGDVMTWALGTAYLCLVDTFAIRAGAWSISRQSTFGIELIRGLPIEEAIFFGLTNYLIIMTSQLISHIHTLQVLSTALPPCPPTSPIAHVKLLFKVALDPPPVEWCVIEGLVESEETLRKGSKSFDVAKLAWVREMRLALIAVYGWCRVTDDMVDSPGEARSAEAGLLLIRKLLREAYTPTPGFDISAKLDSEFDRTHGPSVPSEAELTFLVFSRIIPRLVPIEFFNDLCAGYQTDLAFSLSTHKKPGRRPSNSTTRTGELNEWVHQRPAMIHESLLPIATSQDLLLYADQVAGSVAGMICYLSWSILTPDFVRPRPDPVSMHFHPSRWAKSSVPFTPGGHRSLNQTENTVVQRAREMGQALQLVNVARDVAKDAIIGRVYVPLAWFPSASDLLSVLLRPPTTGTNVAPSYAPYTIPLLKLADSLRKHAAPAINLLPRGARGGTRAMVASYFEIAEEIKRRGGEIEVDGVKVDGQRRALAAVRAMWL